MEVYKSSTLEHSPLMQQRVRRCGLTYRRPSVVLLVLDDLDDPGYMTYPLARGRAKNCCVNFVSMS